MQNSSQRCEIIHHPAKNHVDVGINPKWCKQDQDKPSTVKSIIGRLVDSGGAKDISACFPQSTHGDHPAAAFTVYYGLGNVRDQDEAEKDGVEVCGEFARAEGPIGVWRASCWAIIVYHSWLG